MNKTMSRDIPIELIDPDPEQPRRHFDPIALQELADSLTANGQIVPITVRPVGERFVIVQGERRWRAAQLARLTTLRAEVSDIAPDAAYLLALIENVQRNDLSPLEEANAYERLLANGFNQTSLGKRIGKSQSYIAQKLRLLQLSNAVASAVADGRLTEGHARQLLRLEDTETIEELAEKAIANEWPVNRLWYDVTLALLVTKPSKNYKFKDLLEFADKLKPYEDGGECAEHCVRTYFAVGDILNFGERVWEEYKLPWVVQAYLKERSLSEIAALMSVDRDLNRTGHDIRNAMDLASVPEERFEILIKQAWVELLQVDPSPENHTDDALRTKLYELAKAETMSRDIEAVPA
jgi:ParB family chromosome partitioning protein